MKRGRRPLPQRVEERVLYELKHGKCQWRIAMDNAVSMSYIQKRVRMLKSAGWTFIPGGPYGNTVYPPSR